jgi:hypothetical protein
VKTLVLFIDHTNFLRRLRDDVLMNPGPLPGAGQPGAAQPEAAQPGAGQPEAAHPGAGQPEVGQPGAAPPEADQPEAADPETAQPEASSSSSIVEIAAEDVDDEYDTDSTFEFFDSDFDAEDGDDDLFSDNVDKSVNDHNEKEIAVDKECEDALEDEELNLGVDIAKSLQSKLKAFNPEVDMDNPSFKIGMVFSGVEELRKALGAYSVRNRVHVKKKLNDKRRLEAHCAPGCSWMIKASNDARRTGGFVIKSYEGTHTCERSWPLKAITSKLLTEKFLHEFKDNQKLGLQSFAAKVIREFKMCPNRYKLSRARKAALLQIHGDEEMQFSLLREYGLELRRSNPGSKFFVTTNSVNDPSSPDHREHLATCYWSYDACKRGFLAGCRPFICLDGCHIKTRYKGQLLTAVGIDPNDNIFPIAFGLVEVECTSSWEWFLTNLKDDLNITNTSPWTIMSDKQKVWNFAYLPELCHIYYRTWSTTQHTMPCSLTIVLQGLINAVEKIFPDAEHRFCVRHMIQNFQRAGHRGETLKNDVWAIARSTNIPKWQKSMDKLEVDSHEAFQWIEQLVPNTWIKAFFNEFPKCDMLLNNHSEVFNR